MIRRHTTLMIVGIPLIPILIAGCRPPKQRPGAASLHGDQVHALKKLDVFVGKWEMAGEVRRDGYEEPRHLHGFNEARWDKNAVFLIADGSASVDGGPVNHGLAAWTYDPVARAYRFVMLDSSGATGIGTAEYDETDRTLQARLTSEGPSGPLRMEASVRFVDANTKEEHWTAFDGNGRKVFEVEKTERRCE